MVIIDKIYSFGARQNDLFYLLFAFLMTSFSINAINNLLVKVGVKDNLNAELSNSNGIFMVATAIIILILLRRKDALISKFIRLYLLLFIIPLNFTYAIHLI